MNNDQVNLHKALSTLEKMQNVHQANQCLQNLVGGLETSVEINPNQIYYLFELINAENERLIIEMRNKLT